MSGLLSSSSPSGKGDMQSKSGSDSKNFRESDLTPVGVSGPIAPVIAAPSPANLNPGPLMVLGNVVLDGVGQVRMPSATGRLSPTAAYTTDQNGAITLSSAAFRSRTANGRMPIPSFDSVTGKWLADSNIVFARGTELSVRYNDPDLGLDKLRILNRTTGLAQIYKVEQGRTYRGDGYTITFGGEAAPEYNAALRAAQRDSARTLGYVSAAVISGGVTAGVGTVYLGTGLAAEALTGGLSFANSNFFFNQARGQSNSVTSYATDFALAAALAPVAKVIGAAGSWGLSRLTQGSAGTVGRAALDPVAEAPSLRETIVASLEKSASFGQAAGVGSRSTLSAESRDNLLAAIRQAGSLSEAKGLVFAQREGLRLGYDNVLPQLTYRGSHGIDLALQNSNTLRYAVFEAKGGFTQTSLSALSTDVRGITQGSARYIDTRIQKYLDFGDGLNNTIAVNLQNSRITGTIDSFASFYGSRSTYQLPLTGSSVRPAALVP